MAGQKVRDWFLLQAAGLVGSASFFKIILNIFLDTLIQKRFFLIMTIIFCWGDLYFGLNGNSTACVGHAVLPALTVGAYSPVKIF